MNQLQEIENILKTYTAIDYATKDCEVEANDTLEEMRGKWGYDTDTMETCRRRSFNSSLDRYAKAIKMYTGFSNNGKVFVLHKKDRFVSFLYQVDKNNNTAMCYVHYNPLNVDCIELSIRADYAINGAGNDLYDFSLDEERIIAECDKLIEQPVI